MSKGFDSNSDLTKYAQGLRNNGYDFVGRYYNINNPSKNLSLAEAHVLSTAGLNIVSIWENGFPTTAGYFSHDKGVYDGTNAYQYANQQIGQAALTPIYFTVDYDATDDDIADLIIPYFQGVQDGYNTISQNQSNYLIGVYGSGNVCAALMQAKLASFYWLAQSTGWGGYGSFTSYNIKQGAGIVECPDLGGIAGDPNVSPNDNEGSFKSFAFL